MPLPMVHLCVSKQLIESGFKPKNLAQFYLGSISPDAIHMRKDSDRMAKNETHLMPRDKKWADIDENKYLLFLSDFLDANMEKTDSSFLFGYINHVLTDMYWTGSVFQKFSDDYSKDTSPIQENRQAYYNDTDALDLILFNESEYRSDIWRNLKSVECQNFLDLLSKHEIEAWKERTVHWYDNEDNKPQKPIRYITKADILSFIDTCAASIMKCKIFA